MGKGTAFRKTTGNFVRGNRFTHNGARGIFPKIIYFQKRDRAFLAFPDFPCSTQNTVYTFLLLALFVKYIIEMP